MFIDCLDSVVKRNIRRHRGNDGFIRIRHHRSRCDCATCRNFLRKTSCNRIFPVVFPFWTPSWLESGNSGLSSDTSLPCSSPSIASVLAGLGHVGFRSHGRVSGSSKTQGIISAKHPMPRSKGSHRLCNSAVELIAGPRREMICAPHWVQEKMVVRCADESVISATRAFKLAPRTL